MELFVTANGEVRALYEEEIPLEEMGAVSITRASFLEPTAAGQWMVDLAPVGGPQLGPFQRRSQGLQAERRWLVDHILQAPHET